MAEPTVQMSGFVLASFMFQHVNNDEDVVSNLLMFKKKNNFFNHTGNFLVVTAQLSQLNQPTKQKRLSLIKTLKS